MQGLIFTTTLFLKRSEILNLITLIRERFWNYEVMDLTEKNRKYCANTYKMMNNLILLVITANSIVILIFFFIPLCLVESPTTFPLHRLPWMSITQVKILEMIVASFGEIIPHSMTMCFLMTIHYSTQLQFRMLSNEIEEMFNEEEGFSSKEVKKIIDYHNFLLG